MKSLAGLALWLNASVGVATDSNGVTKWSDQSGNANDATPNGMEPTVIASGIHALPSIHFEGGSHLDIADSTTLQIGTSDFSLSIVMRHTTDTQDAGNYGLVFAKQDPLTTGFPGIATFVDLPANTTSFFGQIVLNSFVNTATTGLNNNAPHVFGFRRVGAQISTRLDGAVDGTETSDAAAVDLSALTTPARIGAGGDGNTTYQQLKGDVAELVLVKGTTSDPTLIALEQYLKSKYGL